MSEHDGVRLDKWLWAARFFKTRGLARDVIQGGKVQYNGQRTKPSRLVEVGATITVRQGHDNKEVVVLKVEGQRKSAPQAQLLYEETEASIALRAQHAELRKLSALHAPHPDRRPDKKQRRELIKVKSQRSEN
ncbi:MULTISPECIES: ribosome-associated heat shock protein Hsp15 [unclassified Motilimonas]|uniref:ribosome-associated heat shock protein Hsp15 n=1 Tax=unclassified Motilimonas TaxID=2643697 RepID=UPI001E355E59|nr:MULTISPECIES: ribosome-associated heat shock protein Hsp15 [unclassified Motilimonas]MCE0557363.1 ribosome-associated heat shock protein Hsp15 [Motilimonas sp. E26]MDO6527351.1 ribosome-associated heat shock protein Hsp15 [Motilimonas sp. 1_MG-2023]